MSNNSTVNVSNGYSFGNFLYTLICISTAMIGYTIHGSLFWAIVDFIFTPIVWIKWLCFHEVNMSIIRETFTFFLN